MKTHSGIKKRFRTRASGAVLAKPAGRTHGMSKHSKRRNKAKGASVVYLPGAKGHIAERVMKRGLEMPAKLAKASRAHLVRWPRRVRDEPEPEPEPQPVAQAAVAPAASAPKLPWWLRKQQERRAVRFSVTLNDTRSR